MEKIKEEKNTNYFGLGFSVQRVPNCQCISSQNFFFNFPLIDRKRPLIINPFLIFFEDLVDTCFSSGRFLGALLNPSILGRPMQPTDRLRPTNQVGCRMVDWPVSHVDVGCKVTDPPSDRWSSVALILAELATSDSENLSSRLRFLKDGYKLRLFKVTNVDAR